MPQQPGPERTDPGPLTRCPWALELASGPKIAPYLTLLPDGRLGGSGHRSETSWNLHENRLEFLDDTGIPSASFLVSPFTLNPETRLPGKSVQHGSVVLRPLAAHLQHTPPPPCEARRRRNLVLLRAGPTSLHPFWLRDIADADRSWDLCLSWYGDPTARPDDCDFFFPGRGTKFEGLANLVASEALPWQYDHVWLPDDDLMTGWADINKMFALCAAHDLMLAQPSLEKDCFINHPITQQNPGLSMRFTTFVEIMAPVFSHAALRLCAPTFSATKSGYGLDHIWPRLIGAPPNKIAIIDAMSVVHTRPIGATYDLAGAIAEGDAMEQAYGAFRRYQVLGFMLAEPHGFVRLRAPADGKPVFLTGEAAKAACA